MEEKSVLSAVRIINDINLFVIEAEELIVNTSREATEVKQRAHDVYHRKISQSNVLFQGKKNKITNNSKDYLSRLSKAMSSIQEEYNKLLKKDKYFNHYVANYKDELGLDLECNLEEDGLEHLSRVQQEHNKLIENFIKTEESPFGAFVAYKILGRRKKRYKKIVSLNLCGEHIYNIAKKDIQEVTNSLLAECDTEHKNEILQIESFYTNEIEHIDKKYESTYIQLADELCEKIDTLFPKEKIEKLCENLNFYEKQFGSVSQTDEFNESITVGVVEYPIDTYISSNVLKTVIREKFAGLIRDGIIKLPAMCEMDKGLSLYLSCKEKDNARLISFVHSVMYGFMSFVPVSKLKMTIIDPEGKGNSIRPYLDFYRECGQLFDDKIVTSTEAVHSKLVEINNYMDDLIQFKLGNKYENIYEYNKASKNKQESLRVLLIFSFPQAFDARNMDLLLSLIKNGKRCGIYTIICNISETSIDSRLSRYEDNEANLKRIKDLSTSIEYRENELVLAQSDLLVEGMPIPDSLEVDRFLKKYLITIESASKKGLSLSEVLLDDNYQQASANAGVKIPIGVGDGNKIISFDIGMGSSHHALIVGATGSGKSTLLHTIITSAMMTYSPSELNLYLMDFKSGTEFKVYEREGLSHIRLIALDALQEFGESIFEELVQEMNKRSVLFKNNGCTNLGEYKTKTGMGMPRILVIIDEFQVLFNDRANRKVASHCAELANKIVTEGRSFGVHLIMATQTTKVLHELSLSQGTIEQMRIRVGLKCAEYDAEYMFKNNPARALNLMKGAQGTAVINYEYTENESEGFRVAYCSKELREHYLNKIKELGQGYKNADLRVFEGERVPYWEDHAGKFIGESTNVQMCFGEPIKVAPPFIQEFDKKKRCNLLVVGGNDELSKTLQTLILLSIGRHSSAKAYCLDGGIFVGENDLDGVYDTIGSLRDCFVIAKDPKDIVTCVNELYDEFSRRKQESATSTDPLFMFINNLQWIDQIQKLFKDEIIEEEKDDSGEETFSFGRGSSRKEALSRKLLKMIEEGSRYGVYFIVTSNDYQVVKDSMIYGENIINKFPLRMVFALSDNEADYLISGVTVSNLKDNIAYFTDGVKNIFQFKPYKVKDITQIDKW